MNRRDTVRSLIAAAGAAFAPGAARPQAGFTKRPLRIGDKVKTHRDVHFFVENRTGGNSTIGGLDVQRAAPDGCTVLFHASTHNVARLVLKNAPSDTVADFT